MACRLILRVTLSKKANSFNIDMYAVIFRAEINQLNSRYAEMATQMRELAIK